MEAEIAQAIEEADQANQPSESTRTLDNWVLRALGRR